MDALDGHGCALQVRLRESEQNQSGSPAKLFLVQLCGEAQMFMFVCCALLITGAMVSVRESSGGAPVGLWHYHASHTTSHF